MRKVLAFDIGGENFAWSIVMIPQEDCLLTQCIVEQFDLVSLGTYVRLHEYLKEKKNIFGTCEYILIEQQMKINIKALKMSQHVLAFFLIFFPEKTVLEFSSHHKTRTFGLTQQSTKKERKKFSILKVQEILKLDPVMEEMFGLYKKKDDIADCILMCLAYAHRNHWIRNDLDR